MLKELVRERLIAAADDIYVLFETTMASYKEQLCRAREETERHRRQLEAVCKAQIVVRVEDVEQQRGRQDELSDVKWRSSSLEHEYPQFPHIKEEEEEEEEAGISGATSAESDNEGVEPPEWSQLHHGSLRGRPLPDNLLTLSDGHRLEEPLGSGTNCEDLQQLIGDQEEVPSQPLWGLSGLELKILQQPHVAEEADVYMSEAIHPKRQEPELTHIKEEEDVGKEVHHLNEQKEQTFLCTIKEEEELGRPCIKEEGEDCCDLKKEEEEMPLTGVPVKSLDEVSKGAEPPSCSSNQQMTREGDGDCCGGSGCVLKKHMTMHTRKKNFSCSVCGQRFSVKTNLKRHTRIHTGEKPFPCSVCGQKFSEKATLTSHTRIHTGEKPFSCSVCGRRFSRRGPLTHHSRTHTGEKPFSCLVCGQTFGRQYTLKSHTRTHTGEKPFSCSVCGQNFTRRGYLIRHIRIHTGEKPFSCSVCGKILPSQEHLTTHTRTHTGEKPFSCSVCGHKFSHRRSLIRHTRIHTGENSFSCSVCGQKFGDKRTLKNHTRVHTRENPVASSVTWQRVSMENSVFVGEMSNGP
ncbi:zinc finger protein 260-like [Syngnathus typhle]|uniref:zinc finger protein 260-like n=1 Tax=Syngnathus typhle TaxID=161592 RepID=UPI002A6B0C78|nr:zinc finger protein 260-like [Syngnathus typhle]